MAYGTHCRGQNLATHDGWGGDLACFYYHAVRPWTWYSIHGIWDDAVFKMHWIIIISGRTTLEAANIHCDGTLQWYPLYETDGGSLIQQQPPQVSPQQQQQQQPSPQQQQSKQQQQQLASPRHHPHHHKSNQDLATQGENYFFPRLLRIEAASVHRIIIIIHCLYSTYVYKKRASDIHSPATPTLLQYNRDKLLTLYFHHA